jgi:GNAT superfamily N-acetyltransferase
MIADDLTAIYRLAQQVSWPHRLEDCAQLFRLGAGIVAIDAAGEVIGAGMRWSFGSDVGTIGMVLVTPGRQGRGIGRAVMTALIAESGRRALMLNATVEGQGLYEKLGFVAIGRFRQHQARLTERLVLRTGLDVSPRRAVAADCEPLCALDAAVFGADRSPLISQLLAAGEAWVIDGAAGLAGFAIRRVFGRGTMIGPVIAPGEDEAISLVAAAASTAPPGVLRIDVPTHAERLGAWLTALSIPAVDAVTTMRRGNWPTTQRRPQRFGLALQAVG